VAPERHGTDNPRDAKDPGPDRAGSFVRFGPGAAGSSASPAPPRRPDPAKKACAYPAIRSPRRASGRFFRPRNEVRRLAI